MLPLGANQRGPAAKWMTSWAQQITSKRLEEWGGGGGGKKRERKSCGWLTPPGCLSDMMPAQLVICSRLKLPCSPQTWWFPEPAAAPETPRHHLSAENVSTTSVILCNGLKTHITWSTWWWFLFVSTAHQLVLILTLSFCMLFLLGHVIFLIVSIELQQTYFLSSKLASCSAKRQMQSSGDDVKQSHNLLGINFSVLAACKGAPVVEHSNNKL